MPFDVAAPEIPTHDPAAPPGPPEDWPQRRRITAWLMGAWGLVTVGGAYFARDLSGAFGGWPLGFWVAAQGAPIAYGLLVWVYDSAMARLDRAAAGQGSA